MKALWCFATEQLEFPWVSEWIACIKSMVFNNTLVFIIHSWKHQAFMVGTEAWMEFNACPNPFLPGFQRVWGKNPSKWMGNWDCCCPGHTSKAPSNMPHASQTMAFQKKTGALHQTMPLVERQACPQLCAPVDRRGRGCALRRPWGTPWVGAWVSGTGLQGCHWETQIESFMQIDAEEKSVDYNQTCNLIKYYRSDHPPNLIDREKMDR